METAPPHPRTLEEAISDALAAGDDATAAVLLRRAFGRPAESITDDLPELLEELAEYYVSQDRCEEALAAATRAAEIQCAESEDALRCRARVAKVMLRTGLAEDAYALYAALAEEAPGQTWIHEAAGSDYVEVEEFEVAHAWLTAGLEVAIASEQPAECVRRLCGLRRIAMTAIGLPADDLDQQGCARFAYPERGAIAPGANTTEAQTVLLADAWDTSHVPRRSALRLLARLREVSGQDHVIVLPEPASAEAMG